jgi:hypothetical protein
MMKRVIGAQMEVVAALEAMKRSQREAERDKRQVAGTYLDRLRSDRDLAMANLEQALAAEEAMRMYPPIRRRC